MATETKTESQTAWKRVREAITERWPQINRDELCDCRDDLCDVKTFVKHRVDANDYEIESMVLEFAPQDSSVQQVVETAMHQAKCVLGAVRSSYLKAHEHIGKQPVETALTSGLAGFLLGITVTALWYSARPEPSAWNRLTTRSRK